MQNLITYMKFLTIAKECLHAACNYFHKQALPISTITFKCKTSLEVFEMSYYCHLGIGHAILKLEFPLQI